MKDLCSENYNTLMKEIENDTKNWKISHIPGLEELIFWIGRINIVKMSYRYNAIPTQILMTFFTELE